MSCRTHPLGRWGFFRRQPALLLALVALALGVAAPTTRGGVTLTNLYSFGPSPEGGYPDGAYPTGTLVEGRDGNLYGLTAGTVFRMTLDGALTTLATFYGTNGSGPHLGLVQGTDGNFYGTTAQGGAWGHGTVFRVTPDGALTTLASFDATNGASPMAELAQGADGNFYGTTSDGGPYHDPDGYGCGTIFQITPEGSLTTLLPFNSVGPSGYDAWGALVEGRDGQFYGTSRLGGAITNAYGWGSGTFFKIDSAGTFTVLAPFDGTNFGGSMFRLVQGVDGNFYGTGEGGTNQDTLGSPLGNVFRATPDGVLTALAGFNGTNGCLARGLMQAADRNFYGLAGRGGLGYDGTWYSGHGTAFCVTPAGELTVLAAFNGTNGDLPFGGLVQARDGNLYGTTLWGGTYGSGPSGTYGYGTIFRLSVPMPPVFKAMTQTGSTLTLTWSTVAGQKYQVQYRANLGQTDWTNLGNPFTATNGTATASDTIAPDPQRLYRIVLLP